MQTLTHVFLYPGKLLGNRSHVFMSPGVCILTYYYVVSFALLWENINWLINSEIQLKKNHGNYIE